jgi:L-malate glycosyltransferase
MTVMSQECAPTVTRADCVRVSKTPRILQLIHSNEAGGVEALSASIAGGLTRHGMKIDTHFLYPSFAIGKWTKIKGIAKTVVEIVRRRPDVLVAYQSTASVLVGVVGRIVGVPLRIVHQTSVPEAVNPLICALDKWVGAHTFYSVNVANSQTTLTAYSTYAAAYRQRMVLIEHGLSPPASRTSRSQTLARWNVPDDGPVLVTAGRLSDQKAQDVLIKALPLVPGARLVIAGGGPNEAAYRALAAGLGVADRTHFLGYVSREEVGDLLGTADAFVFPTRWETFGLAPVEAAMVGVPVVASDLAVLREVLTVDGRSCTTFIDTRAAEAWAEAINAVLQAPSSRKRAADFAPSLCAKYAESRMLDAYVQLVAESLRR